MGKFLLVVIVFAAAVYALFWLIERRRDGTSGESRPSRTVSRPVAPDDDESFLRDIGRRRPDNPRPSDPGPGGPNDGGG